MKKRVGEKMERGKDTRLHHFGALLAGVLAGVFLGVFLGDFIGVFTDIRDAICRSSSSSFFAAARVFTAVPGVRGAALLRGVRAGAGVGSGSGLDSGSGSGAG